MSSTQLPTPLSLQLPTLFPLQLSPYLFLPSLVLSVQSRIKFSDRHLIVLRNGDLGENFIYPRLELNNSFADLLRVAPCVCVAAGFKVRSKGLPVENLMY
jgi:hypothetical protein